MRINNLGRVLIISAAALVAAGAAAIGQECVDKTAAQHANDYPTVTRADYIYGCMMVNGQTREVLEKCSCSIDVIASSLPFKEYEEAETVMSVRQRGGESVAFLYTPAMQEKVKNLKRAQVEGELRCF